VPRKTKKTSQKQTKQNKRKRGGSRLTAKEIANFREMLLGKWKEMVGDVNSMENETLKKSRLDATGDLSSMPIHMADIGTDNYEQEFALGLLDSERKLLKEISDALRRIEEGQYGICEGTGKPISKARLEASPWARYCVEYARMVEEGLVSEDGSAREEGLEEIEEKGVDIEEEEQDYLVDEAEPLVDEEQEQ